MDFKDGGDMLLVSHELEDLIGDRYGYIAKMLVNI
jgi:hypothetical protein